MNQMHITREGVYFSKEVNDWLVTIGELALCVGAIGVGFSSDINGWIKLVFIGLILSRGGDEAE